MDLELNQMNRIKSILKENTDIDVNDHMIHLENEKRKKLKPFFDKANETFLRQSTDPSNYKFYIRTETSKTNLNKSFDVINNSSDACCQTELNTFTNKNFSGSHIVSASRLSNPTADKNLNFDISSKKMAKKKYKKTKNTISNIMPNQIRSDNRVKYSNSNLNDPSISNFSNSKDTNLNKNSNNYNKNNSRTYYNSNNSIVESHSRLINGQTTDNRNFRSRSLSKKKT